MRQNTCVCVCEKKRIWPCVQICVCMCMCVYVCVCACAHAFKELWHSCKNMIKSRWAQAPTTTKKKKKKLKEIPFHGYSALRSILKTNAIHRVSPHSAPGPFKPQPSIISTDYRFVRCNLQTEAGFDTIQSPVEAPGKLASNSKNTYIISKLSVILSIHQYLNKTK